MGPDPDGKGGISVVIKSILSCELSGSYNMGAITTFADTKLIWHFAKAISQTLALSRKRTGLVQIHLASKGSFFRKSLLAEILRAKNIPYIIHLHGARFREFYDGSNVLIKRRCKKMFDGAKAIILLTPPWEAFAERLGVGYKSVVISNFVRLTSFVKTPGSDKDLVQILFLGRLGARKGAGDLLRAIKILSEKDIKYKFSLILAGDGDIEGYRKLSQRLHIEAFVRFVGWADEELKDRLLRESDILTLPSRGESFGLSIIEGMNYSLPVIAGKIDSVSSVARHGEDGFLVVPGDIEALAQRLETLIRDPDLRLKMGRAGRARAEREFSEEAAVKKFSALYEKILENSPD